MSKKEVAIISMFGAIFLFSVIMLLIQNIPSQKIEITGQATTGTTTSNVTISKFLSIDMSGNLSTGILFGTVNALPAVDINASSNNNSGGNSTFYLNVSTDSNIAVDFCIKADADLYDSLGGSTLGVGNESYANATITNMTLPDLSNQVPFTTSYIKSGYNITRGNVNYYRFWLDIPSGTPSGTYNNTLTFKGIEIGTSC